MRGYADLGDSVGKLIGTFLNKDAIQQKGYMDYAPKTSQMRYYDAKTQDAMLDVEQKQRSQAITPEEIAQSFFGIDPSAFSRIQAGDVDQYGEAGPTTPIDPQLVDQGRRAAGVHKAFQMGGGNVDQILASLLKSQRMNSQDMIMSGGYEAPDVGRAVAASEGKALYNDGASGILDVFGGGVDPTARSKAATAADYALAEQRQQEKALGGKDPAKAKLATILKGRGLSDDQAWEIALMDSVPKEQFIKLVTAINSQAMVPNLAKAREEAKSIMVELYGNDWMTLLSGAKPGGTAPPEAPTDNDPLGIR